MAAPSGAFVVVLVVVVVVLPDGVAIVTISTRLLTSVEKSTVLPGAATTVYVIGFAPVVASVQLPSEPARHPVYLVFVVFVVVSVRCRPVRVRVCVLVDCALATAAHKAIAVRAPVIVPFISDRLLEKNDVNVPRQL